MATSGPLQPVCEGGLPAALGRHITLAVSRAKSRSEARAEAVGVGSSAWLGVLDDVCEHPDELAQIVDVVFFEV